jgi:hypothetical protein
VAPEVPRPVVNAWFRGFVLVAALAVALGACAARPTTPPVTFGPDVGLAQFWVNPASLPLAADATSISGFIREQECASGQSPEGRIIGPRIEYASDSITVTFGVTKVGGDCPSNPSYSITIFLAEKLGNRRVLDGGSTPARDATVEPAGGG